MPTRSHTRSLLLPLLVLFTFTATALACLWDSDTLKMEADSFPGIAEVLTGRFERQPPRYYEMRLERVTRLLASDPGNLAAYDDAGVACDRLGRSDDAIAWMARKSQALSQADQSAAATRDHLYRYHANLGTFHAHRWIRSGAPRENLADLKTAESEIAQAIRINPDAHFGREKYQLAAIRWLIELPATTESDQPTFLTPLLEPARDQAARKAIAADAIKGLTGLIVMGDAWQSVDVHWALLAMLGQHDDASLMMLADLRMQELLASGRKSFHPQFEPEISRLPRESLTGEPYDDAVTDIRTYFIAARKSATEWSAARDAFMQAKFDKGEHPDTNPDFWKGWVNPPAPTLPDTNHDPRRAATILVGSVLAVFLVAVITTGILLVKRRIRNRQPTAASAA